MTLSVAAGLAAALGACRPPAVATETERRELPTASQRSAEPVGRSDAGTARAEQRDDGAAADAAAAASMVSASASATPSPAPSAEPTTAAEAAQEPYRVIWQHHGVPRPKSLVIAPWGDVVAFGARKLSVFAGDTGDLLTQKGICYTFRGAFGFVDSRTGVLVCEDSIKVFSFPGLAYRGVRSLPGKARTAAFGQALVAVGFADGPVRLYDTADWSQDEFVALGERATALAIAPTERWLAVALRDGRLVIHDRQASSHLTLRAEPGDPVTELAFSPDGRRLLASSGSAWALWDVRRGVRERAEQGDGAIGSARWLSSEQLVVVREGRLSVLAVEGGDVEPLDGRPSREEGRRVADLAVSRDARLICSASERRRILCLARGPVSPTGASSHGATPARATEQAAKQTAGRLVGHTGRHLTMAAHRHTELPSVGIRARLHRHVLIEQGELLTSGWPGVAVVTVDRVHKGRLHLTIVEDESEQALGPSKRDPFEYDTPVRLVWSEQKP